MSKAPLLIDRSSLARRRSRSKAGRGYFLHQEAISDLQDRLQMITKPFTDITIVTGHPAPWAEAFPTARILPDDEVLKNKQNDTLLWGILGVVIGALVAASVMFRGGRANWREDVKSPFREEE